jgi:hypothetical protein
VTPLEPGEIAFYHNAFPALREARHELWKVGKLRHQNGGRGNGSNGRRFTGIGGLDLEQLMLACAKVNNGRGTGAVVEEKLKHKVLLARNLRRGIETRARLKMKG